MYHYYAVCMYHIMLYHYYAVNGLGVAGVCATGTLRCVVKCSRQQYHPSLAKA